jgi:hypothetical protein
LDDRTTRGLAPASIKLAMPPAGRSRRSSMARSLAWASRSGAPSSAAMEPDVSTMKTVWRARGASVRRTGWAAATASRATARSWRTRGTLTRNRCQGDAADTGTASSRHR